MSSCNVYVCMYAQIRRHQHTRVHAHTGPRRHARAPSGVSQTVEALLLLVWMEKKIGYTSIRIRVE